MSCGRSTVLEIVHRRRPVPAAALRAGRHCTAVCHHARGPAGAPPQVTSDAPLVLGALGSGSQPAREAAVDELRVYSRGLTASEVLALYAEGAG